MRPDVYNSVGAREVEISLGARLAIAQQTLRESRLIPLAHEVAGRITGLEVVVFDGERNEGGKLYISFRSSFWSLVSR